MSGISARWMLLLAASGILVGVVALVVAIGVIPPVRAGCVPNITSERAVPALWVTVALHLLAAVVLLLMMALSKVRSGGSTSVLIVTGVAIPLVGFALGDAAKAPLEVGATMRTVTVLLLACVGADVLAGGLTIAAALLRPARVGALPADAPRV